MQLYLRANYVALCEYGRQRSLTTQLLSQVPAGRLLQILTASDGRKFEHIADAQFVPGDARFSVVRSETKTL